MGTSVNYGNVAANAAILKRLAEIDKTAFRQSSRRRDTIANTRDGCAPRRKNATAADRRYKYKNNPAT